MLDVLDVGSIVFVDQLARSVVIFGIANEKGLAGLLLGRGSVSRRFTALFCGRRAIGLVLVGGR